jgi:CDP-glycerol glycerophosphotransferase
MIMLVFGQKIFNTIAFLLPVDKRKIAFINYYGKGYGDNPKYIAQYIINHKNDFNLVWLVRGLKSIEPGNFPESIRLVEYYSFNALFELATAGIWIDNCRKDFYPSKKRSQIYIQTWHGGLTPLKKVEQDAHDLSRYYVRKAKKDSKMADYIVSGCKERTGLIKSSFWYDHAILEAMEPRCDIFFTKENSLKDTILRKYDLPNDCYLILYAPTFRNANFENDISCYCLDMEKIIRGFSGYFHTDKVTILFRMHPNVAGLFDANIFPWYIKNVSGLPDMQELLFISDALITDYSDVQFYFALMKKPVFLFTPDLEQYMAAERWFYHDFTELPFPLAKTNDELCDNIRFFDLSKYLENITVFMKKQNYILDRKASDEIYALILQYSHGDALRS